MKGCLDFQPTGKKLINETDKILVLGGSGFIGRHIVRRLAKTKAQIVVGIRQPNKALFLKNAGRPGQVQIIQTNITQPHNLSELFAGVTGVVNCVGILYETRQQKFMPIQAQGAAQLAQQAARCGIKKFVHISALGADAQSRALYAQSKAEGERGVRQAIASAHIVRPSLVIGPEDDFFNRFAALALISPVLPLIGDGTTRYQPVVVFDVAESVFACLNDEADGIEPGIYELGGPQIYSFKELMILLLAQINRPRLLVPMPFFVARLIAAFAQFMPKPLLTPDQVKLLQSDNVVDAQAAKFDALGISPQPIEAVLPTYLKRFRPPQKPH